MDLRLAEAIEQEKTLVEQKIKNNLKDCPFRFRHTFMAINIAV
jgi:hypothetical protein